jgi:hypothetical protein
MERNPFLSLEQEITRYYIVSIKQTNGVILLIFHFEKLCKHPFQSKALASLGRKALTHLHPFLAGDGRGVVGAIIGNYVDIE